MRVNDNHFDGAQIGDLPDLHHTELTSLRQQHPEWLLGERTSDWFALSWDLSVPEVRRYRLDHLREICERYDWDGVELDWQRHPFHLPEDEAYRLRYALTDLQRAARHMVDQGTGGRIVCLASVHAYQAWKDWTAYGVAKAGLRRMVKGLAIDLQGTGVTANCIAPGAIASALRTRTSSHGFLVMLNR